MCQVCVRSEEKTQGSEITKREQASVSFFLSAGFYVIGTFKETLETLCLYSTKSLSLRLR